MEIKEGICQVVSEYRRFQETGRLGSNATFPLPDGSLVELCRSNGIDLTLSVVRAGDDATRWWRSATTSGR